MLLTEFLESESNRTWTQTVVAQTMLSVFPVYNDALQQATLAQLDAAGCTLEELVRTGQQHEALFLRHVVALVALTAGASLEQAYGDDDGPRVWQPTKVLGVSRDFLVPHLIVFLYLLKRPEQLAAYLKKTRNVRPTALARTYLEGFERLRRAQ